MASRPADIRMRMTLSSGTAVRSMFDLGASVISEGIVRFKVWAPGTDNLSVRVSTPDRGARDFALHKNEWGYHEGMVMANESDHYYYVIDSTAVRPDPASRFQPEGVHGPSQIVDPSAFAWKDGDWKGKSLKDYIIYEVHIGTFTPEGTFDAAIDRLDHLKDLGITAVEIMPVCQFPGNRNWGYDGVYPFAPQNTYGGPAAFKRLIDTCHGKGLAVVLDVVYNHLGPEGNYFGSYAADYFTDRYKTPWGDAINFDGPLSDPVRHYFISNAIYWLTEYHIDALRLDAVQGIFDFSACHFLKELAACVHRESRAVGREFYVIAESDLNDVRIIDPPEAGGYGLDAVWNDDFHHSLHALLTGDKRAYYCDFGRPAHMAKALREGFVYSGQYSPHRRRRHGNSSKGRPGRQFVVFSQNHDQTCNTMERPACTESLGQLKLRAGIVLLSPCIPLLFMGEEYGEKAPFHYFVSHLDPALGTKVANARDKEFSALWNAEPSDPRAESTFLDSKIMDRRTGSEEQDRLYSFYRMLVRLRTEIPALGCSLKERARVRVFRKEKMLFMKRLVGGSAAFLLFNFKDGSSEADLRLPEGTWRKMLDSEAVEWGGDGSEASDVIKSEGDTILFEMPLHSLLVYALESTGET